MLRTGFPVHGKKAADVQEQCRASQMLRDIFHPVRSWFSTVHSLLVIRSSLTMLASNIFRHFIVSKLPTHFPHEWFQKHRRFVYPISQKHVKKHMVFVFWGIINQEIMCLVHRRIINQSRQSGLSICLPAKEIWKISISRLQLISWRVSLRSRMHIYKSHIKVLEHIKFFSRFSEADQTELTFCLRGSKHPGCSGTNKAGLGQTPIYLPGKWVMLVLPEPSRAGVFVLHQREHQRCKI